MRFVDSLDIHTRRNNLRFLHGTATYPFRLRRAHAVLLVRQLLLQLFAVAVKIKFTFCFRSTVVLLCEPSSKNGMKFTHRFYGFRMGKALTRL